MSKLFGILGIARRAGKLSAGFDLCISEIKEGKAKLVLVASDISDKSFKNISFEAEKAEIKALRIEENMQDLGKACGIKAGIVAITDEGFAGKIEEILMVE